MLRKSHLHRVVSTRLLVVVLDWLEVGVLHRVSWCYSLRVVILKHLRQQIDRLVGHQLVVLGSDELSPGFAWVSAQNVVVV